jgi:[calcium/calmodulin-dependent protein kinase] kinase
MKEFSKSQLHTQALQQKHRQGTRTRLRRRPQQGEGAKQEENDDRDGEGPRSGPWGSTKTMDEDPLGLIRREIAVMKKLE